MSGDGAANHMAENSDIKLQEMNYSNELQERIEEYLKKWKGIIVFGNKVLVSKNHLVPVIMFFVVSIIFLYLWWVDCSLINSILIILIDLTLLDYVLCSSFLDVILPKNWDADDKSIYPLFVQSLTRSIKTSKLYIKRFFALRQTNSDLFHSVTVVSLICLLYIGVLFNHLFLMYITVLGTLLYPSYTERADVIKEHLGRWGHEAMRYFWC